jgi:hypothetical protein
MSSLIFLLFLFFLTFLISTHKIKFFIFDFNLLISFNYFNYFILIAPSLKFHFLVSSFLNSVFIVISFDYDWTIQIPFSCISLYISLVPFF